MSYVTRARKSRSREGMRQQGLVAALLALELNYAHMRDTGLLQSVYPFDPPTARTWNI